MRIDINIQNKFGYIRKGAYLCPMENYKTNLVVGARYLPSKTVVLEFVRIAYEYNVYLALFRGLSGANGYCKRLKDGLIPFTIESAESFEREPEGVKPELKDLVNTFKNDTEIDFKDISNEKFRVYNFPNGATVRIENPKSLHVSASGGHRIANDKFGYYVQPREGWWIVWAIKEGSPAFVL